MTLVKEGACSQAHILAEGGRGSQDGGRWSRGADASVNDFSASLSMKKTQKSGFKNFSSENTYLKACSASLSQSTVPHF